MARDEQPTDDQASDEQRHENARPDPAGRADGSRRPDDEAPGNFVDDPNADEVPEPNEPA